MHLIESEIDRNQLSMIALEQMVDQNSFARLVDVFVNALPMRSCYVLLKVYLQEKNRLFAKSPVRISWPEADKQHNFILALGKMITKVTNAQLKIKKVIKICLVSKL